MASLWDEMKRGMKSWGTAAAVRAEELGRAVAYKSEELAKIGSLKLQIIQKERDLEGAFARIGRHVFATAEAQNKVNFSGDSELWALMRKIKELQEEVEDLRKRIAAVKEEHQGGAGAKAKV